MNLISVENTFFIKELINWKCYVLLRMKESELISEKRFSFSIAEHNPDRIINPTLSTTFFNYWTISLFVMPSLPVTARAIYAPGIMPVTAVIPPRGNDSFFK